MKKVLLISEDPVGASLRVVLTKLRVAEFVRVADKADVVLACGRAEVTRALEETSLPVWQVTSRDSEPVNNERVRHFQIQDCGVTLMFALEE